MIQAEQINPVISGTILVVDDEPYVRRLIERFVQRLGCTTLAAADGAEALAILTHGPPLRALLLDISMAGMSGDQLLLELDRAGIALPIVLMSGHSATDLAPYLRDRQQMVMLQKPFTLAELRTTLERVLGAAA